MSEKNYPTFRNLLWQAIGARTQAQFANDAGISAEHLNRMLNASKINRPTKKTLALIAAAAKNGVSYNDMETALERDSDLAQEDRNAEKGPAPSFREAAVETVRTMSGILDSLRKDLYPCIVDSLDSIVSELINGIKKTYPHAPEISFEVGEARPYIGETHQDVPLQSTVWLSMADMNTSASTEMIVYFSQAAGKLVLHDMSASVADIYDIHGLPFRSQSDQDDEDGKDNVVIGPPLGNGEDPEWDAAYYIRFEKNLRFQAYKYSDPGLSVEQRLLNAVFSTDTICPLWVYGTGFFLDEIPSGFAAFVFKHKKALAEICSTSGDPDDGISGKEFLTGLAKLETKGAGNEEVAAWLDEIKYADRYSMATGWVPAVSAVMTAETGFEFLSYIKQDNKDFGELTQHDVVLINREYANLKKISRESVLNLVYRYAAELGIREFNDMLYKTVEPRNAPEHRYVIQERKPKKEHSAGREVKYVPFVVNGIRQYPTDPGLYAVKLRDGREIEIVFLRTKDQELWIKRHKEWSNLIEAYDPTPLPSSPN